MHREFIRQKRENPTSWESAGSWYKGIVGKEGHYYHKNVIMPNILRLLSLKNGDSVLDLGCGQGFFSNYLPSDVFYVGVDASETLIKDAKRYAGKENKKFFVGDVTVNLPVDRRDFSHVVLVLALQNIEKYTEALKNASKYLKPGGKIAIVLNHPCFRIPRLSSWGIDESKRLEYRRIDRYMSEIKIPVTVNPSKGKYSPVTWTFHRPLVSYSKALKEAGFVTSDIEEWVSDKQSEGRHSKMENLARNEIPLFMAILAEKK